MTKKGVQEVFAATVVSKDFREKFVNPETRFTTIKEGYLGKEFDLTNEEVERLILAEGSSLAEIAQSFNKGSERK